jgi:hypothetical protein
VTTEEFQTWVQALLLEGRINSAQMSSVLAQRALFDSQRTEIEISENFRQRVVGFVRGERLVADSVDSLLNAATRESGDGDLVYFEPVGYAAFGVM